MVPVCARAALIETVPFVLCSIKHTVSHDSLVGDWKYMYLTVCPLHGPSSIANSGEIFQGIFPWQKLAQSPLIGSTTSGHEEEGPSLTMDRHA